MEPTSPEPTGVEPTGPEPRRELASGNEPASGDPQAEKGPGQLEDSLGKETRGESHEDKARARSPEEQEEARSVEEATAHRPDGRPKQPATAARDEVLARRPAGFVRERRLAVAAMQRGEAVEKAHVHTPPRAAVAVPRRAPRGVPQIFAEGYGDFAKSSRAQAVDAKVPEDQQAGSGPVKLRQLRVEPWHRVKLQKMICRALLYQFLLYRREADQLRQQDRPLWPWESRTAQEYSTAGQLAALVKFLVETELHIELGPKRSTTRPGSLPVDAAAELLRAERRQLVRGWEESSLRRRLGANMFDEEFLIRLFLDGRLSWPRIRHKVRAMFGLSQVAQHGEASSDTHASREVQ